MRHELDEEEGPSDEEIRKKAEMSEKAKVCNVLDVTCGGRMCWFDKDQEGVLFMDIRSGKEFMKDRDMTRELEIKPDMKADFRDNPFPEETFDLVLFDPPHLVNAGENGWQRKKYGILSYDWKEDIRQGINECMRVLRRGGTLVFKWNEEQIKVREVLDAIDHSPLFGHTTGRSGKTKWMTFLK